ncbi:hypothetical protein BDF22DRAFT_675270 [Syncephalis plumigaleata]|nr:hypothetical protein BDF22DRAFT_675270 [Syncephalis plumigaleata]
MVLIWMKDEVLRTFPKGLRFIRSPQDQFISKLVQLREKKAHRLREGRILVMTKKTIDKLVKKDIPIRTLGLTVDPRVRKPTFAPSSELLDAPWDHYEADKYIAVNVDVVRRMFGSKARPDPHELWAEVDWPKTSMPEHPTRILALYGVNGEEDFAYLMRAIRAYNWDGAYLLPKTCDIYNDTVQRVSRDTVFDCPYEEGRFTDFIEYTQKHGLTPIVALPPYRIRRALSDKEDIKGKMHNGLRFYNWPEDRPLGEFPEKFALFIASGTFQPILSKMPNAIGVSIPMHNNTPSLGVSNAGAILMNALSVKTQSESNEMIPLADAEPGVEENEFEEEEKESD